MKTTVFILMLSFSILLRAQQFPGNIWMQYQQPEEAGFDSKKLDEILSKHQSIGGASALIVYDGVIVKSSGNVSRKLMDHSMRKSYVSALFGIYVDRGVIDLEESLAAIGIDDKNKLTESEKKATVKDLLSARSGIYHPAAYSPRGMIESLPARSSHDHGTFWLYNNWDFNALATIFKKKTGIDIFEAFKKEIAEPIGMQGYLLSDTFFRYEDISEHPAYLFRLNDLDEARFGLLFMNSGKWGKKQLISKAWIDTSTSAITSALTGFDSREGYGYLWWTTTVGEASGYYASGLEGQRIVVIPKRKLVIVFSTDTYDGSKRVKDTQIDELTEMILTAQTETIKKKPVLSAFQAKPATYPDYTMRESNVEMYSGDYQHRYLGKFTIGFESKQWILKTNVGSFRLYPKSENEFIPEDILFPGIMEKATSASDKGSIKPETAPDKSLVSIHFIY